MILQWKLMKMCIRDSDSTVQIEFDTMPCSLEFHKNKMNYREMFEYLEEIKDREYYMFPDEAKEKGIVDKIIGIDCELSDLSLIHI